MTVKIIYSEACMPFKNKIVAYIWEKFPKIEVETYDELHYKDKKKAIMIKASVLVLDNDTYCICLISSTIHKIQGSSLGTVFIDMANVLVCKNVDEIRQMQYVSLSRTKTDAYILV